MDTKTQRHAVFCELVQDVAAISGEVRLRVRGASMLPAVWPEDVVTVRQSSFAELKRGEVVLFRRDGGLTLHRIVKIAADYAITRGDALRCEDGAVREDEIVGKLVGIDRSGRQVGLGRPVWQRVAGLLLQRSDYAMRVMLGVRSRLRRWSGAPVLPCA
jgi:hypothetical protein